jgi:hypothetical protein
MIGRLVRGACHGGLLKLCVWEDDEESRLLSLYTTHRAKEHAAAHQVLHPSHSLPLRTYLELVGDLRVIRTECNEKWRAIGAHRKKMAYEQSDILC